MNQQVITRTTRTPWYFWLLAVLALLWNAMGCFDYFMTQSHNESYLEQFSPEMLAFVDSFPQWVTTFWALGVWNGLLGSITLLLRKQITVPIYIISCVSMVVVTIRNFGFSDGMDVMGSTFDLLFTGVMFLLAIAQILYAQAMVKCGILR